MLHSRIAANEASAVSSTRTILSAEFSYYQTFGGGTDYAQSLTALGPGNGNLIDSGLASGSKSGYAIALTASQVNGTYFNEFMVSATPLSAGLSGTRSFCAVEDGALRADTTGGTFASHDACTLAGILQ
jgi:hypothetical protein